MNRRSLYADRVFSATEPTAQATQVLVTHADKVECGDHDGKVTVYRSGIPPEVDVDGLWWMTFSKDGREVAGRGEDGLLVHAPGAWDEALDDIPHTRDWWSWIQIDRLTSAGTDSGGGSRNVLKHLKSRWDPARLMTMLGPLDIDYVVVSLVDQVGARPFSRTGGSLLIDRHSPPNDASAGELQQWWVDLFDAVAAKYRLETGDAVPYTAEDEGLLRVATTDGGLPDEDTLDVLVEFMLARGAETDAWYADGSAMCVPIAGVGHGELLRIAAECAEALGLSVVEVHPDPRADTHG